MMIENPKSTGLRFSSYFDSGLREGILGDQSKGI
jgi:hypothetical protein